MDNDKSSADNFYAAVSAITRFIEAADKDAPASANLTHEEKEALNEVLQAAPQEELKESQNGEENNHGN